MAKILGFIKKYRLTIFAVLLIAAIAALFYSRKSHPPTTPATPTPTTFSLIKFYPPQGEQEMALPSTALSFTFSSPVDLSTANIIIKPFVSFEISTDATGKTLYITPSPRWEYDTEYKVTINIKAKGNQMLSSPVEHLFKFKKVAQSDLDEHWNQ